MQGGKLRYYRPGIQSGRGLGGVLRGMGKIASAALRGDVGPVLKSIARKTLINYWKGKAKDFVFGKLTGVKRKKKVQKESGMNGIKRRKKTAKRLSDIFTYWKKNMTRGRKRKRQKGGIIRPSSMVPFLGSSTIMPGAYLNRK